MPYTYLADLAAAAQIPPEGILSRTVHNDEKVKIVWFGFSPGQELSAHTAPMAAVLFFLHGEATVTLGDDQVEAGPGAMIHMPPQLTHGILARTPLSMVLLLLK
jgi:quercetin dioxygenase-like cupin family protein